MAGKTAVKVTLDHSWLNKVIGCVKYIDSFVSSGSDDIFKGLFRIPARESVLSELKIQIGAVDASQGIETTVECLKEFHQSHASDNDGINSVTSLLKWILREFPVALVPFDYATEDLQSRNFQNITEENERGMLGCKFAQDLILTMASQLSNRNDLVIGESKPEIIAHAISAVAQLLSMLCTVARIDEIAMPSQNLFIVFLPSLCNSRDPLQLMEESKRLVELNTRKKQIQTKELNDAGGSQHISVYRFEVHIMFGHRIWGYIEHSLPSLVLALETIAELTVEISPPEHHRRKRDILKRFLNKMRGRSHSHDHTYTIDNNGDNKERSDRPNAFKRGFRKLHNKIHKNKAPNLHLDEKIYSDTGEAETGDIDKKLDEYGEYLGELALLTKSPRFGEEHVKRLAIQRAESVHITSPLVGQWTHEIDAKGDGDSKLSEVIVQNTAQLQNNDQGSYAYKASGSEIKHDFQKATSNKIIGRNSGRNSSSTLMNREQLGNVGKSLLAREFTHVRRRKSARTFSRFDSKAPIQVAHYVSSPDLSHRDV